MRILVTGAAGQLGRELLEVFADHDVVGGEPPLLDITDREQVLQLVDRTEPDAVVHAAAWTDVDGCEGDPDRAFRVNALGTRHVAAAARRVGARVYYVSTDYVFDGTSDRPYTEWDEPRPLSVYGRSKLAGERELGPDDAVVRTSWLCGRYGRNFVKTVLGRALEGQDLRVVDDQHGCFTLAADLATMIRRLVLEGRTGIHHVTNQGPTTWYRVARDVVEAAGLDPSLVRPIRTADMDPPRPAPRPMAAVLDNAALRLSGTELLPDHHDAIRRLVGHLVAESQSVRS
ncbi:MAG: dTDP-4-dehydrorhamnose reductase [Actinomycetota bacterium]|nr:dTDP-4-dehydrorhamnose reductase [Actinomycetota bacterium]